MRAITGLAIGSFLVPLVISACGDDVTVKPSDGDDAGGAATGGASGGSAMGAASQGGNATGGATVGGGGSSTGGAPVGCANVQGDYGDCKAIIGVGFNGSDCVSFSGCDCAPNCGNFFTDLEACVDGCTGYCDAAAFVGAGIASDGWSEGDFCDDIYICADAALQQTLQSIFGDAVDCSDAPCIGGGGLGTCSLVQSGTVTAAEYERFCAMTLVPGVDAIECIVYGP